MELYFSCLPTDLLHLVFLYFEPNELFSICSNLEKLYFSKLLGSRIFWKIIWKHKISSFLNLSENPYEKYKEIFSDLKTLRYKENKIRYLSQSGYDQLLIPLLSTLTDYNTAMYYASESGHIEIVRLMLEKGANSYNLAMAYAARGGHIEIVRLMLENGANDYNWAMAKAAYGGHIEIVRLMLDLNADNYNEAMSMTKNQTIIDLIKSYQNKQ